MNLFQAITDILYDISTSSHLTKESRHAVNQWLAKGHEWELIHELDHVLQIALEAGVSRNQQF